MTGLISSQIGQNGLLSSQWASPSISLAIGGRGDRFGGYITLGQGAGGTSLHSGLYYDGSRHHDRRSHYDGHSYYNYNYRPLHHYVSYAPYYAGHYGIGHGYSYSCQYYPEPYVYEYYAPETVYVMEEPLAPSLPAEPTVAVGAAPEPRDAALVGPPEPPRSLTMPDDLTLIGQGNTAFLGGNFDEARRHYIRAVLADERDGHAKLLYSYANFASGDYTVAGLALQRALLTTATLMDYPVDPRPLYGDSTRLEDQIAELAAHVSARPSDRSAAFMLAYMQYAVGHPAGALAILIPLVEADSADTLAALLQDAVIRAGIGLP